MSTIASPRDTSVTGRRVPLISTPSSSARPSFDSPRGASPSRASPMPQPRKNRSALREYYNLKKAEKEDDASSEYSINDHSDVLESELDREGFNGDAYVKTCLETQTLEELLKTYNQVLSDIRALDAEKKALVYDNYSKLIAATETIHKMRANMSPLNPMASTLDPAIAQIYERANVVKSELRRSVAGSEMSEEDRSKILQRKKARDSARMVLETPERIRKLVSAGKKDDARREWDPVLRVLEKWKDQGVGGSEVQDCIDDGEAALRGEPSGPNSWADIKTDK